MHPQFSMESRNICLGLCIDKLNLFALFVTLYSCSPITLTVYNLSSRMRIRPRFMFLSMIIPDPNSSGQNINVCLWLLIDKLTQLWSSGALIYDISRKHNFLIRVALMWTIYDFPAYGMVSRWSTHGKLACPYCMENKQGIHVNKRR